MHFPGLSHSSSGPRVVLRGTHTVDPAFCALPRSDTSLVAQMVKHLPATQETQVKSLGWEDPLEKGITTHSSLLAWRIPWTEEPGQLQSMGLQRVEHD